MKHAGDLWVLASPQTVGPFNTTTFFVWERANLILDGISPLSSYGG